MRFLMFLGEIVGLFALAFTAGLLTSGALAPIVYKALGEEYPPGHAVFWFIVGAYLFFIFVALNRPGRRYL